jgi:hypothetical protein
VDAGTWRRGMKREHLKKLATDYVNAYDWASAVAKERGLKDKTFLLELKRCDRLYRKLKKETLLHFPQ